MTPDTTVLTTDRLTLRPVAAKDWPGFLAYQKSDRSRYTGGPMDDTAAWREFCVEIAHRSILGFGNFAVTWTGGDDTCLGFVGPWRPAPWPENEIGWMVWPEAEGQGIAYEAALATRAHAFSTLGWETAVSYIDPRNARSIALAERLGAVLDPDADVVDAGDLVYRHTPTEAAL